MKQPTYMPGSRARRIGVAEAKGRLSEVIRTVTQGPLIIHNRGRDVAVLVDVGEWQRLAGPDAAPSGGAAFIARIEAIKGRHGGVADFEPREFDLTPARPFAVRGGSSVRARKQGRR